MRPIVLMTLFPDAVSAMLNRGLLGKALGVHVSLTIVDLRLFGYTRHGHVDDRPYGGKQGLILRPDVVARALESIPDYDQYTVIHPSPAAPSLTQSMVHELARDSRGLIIIPGYYEGLDERIIAIFNVQTVSVGDFVLMNGDLPALAIIESTIRVMPGVIHDPMCVEEDTFPMGLFEHPQYTTPKVFKNHEVPAILRSGNHSKIADWKRQQSLGRTLCLRPDLIQVASLTDHDRTLLRQYVSSV